MPNQNQSPRWSCLTCGTLYPESPQPPSQCPICEDERQYVGWSGQRWEHFDSLCQRHSLMFKQESGITTFGLSPTFAINQRAFLIPDGDSNIMWECLSVVTPEAVAHIQEQGGVKAIAISHPHFYGAMHAWSEAFGGVPIYLHDCDQKWVMDSSPHIVHWSGNSLKLSEDIELIHLPSHFDGSSALYWKSGPRGAILFPGDALQVSMDRRHTGFMYSYPNAIPLRTSVAERLREIVEPIQFEDIYGFTWGRQIIGNAKASVDASFARHLDAVKS